MASAGADSQHSLSCLDLLPEQKIFVDWSQLDARNSHVYVGVDVDGAERAATSGLLHRSVKLDWTAVDSEGAGCSRLRVPRGSI